MQCVLSAKVIFAYICKIETHALYVSYSQCDVYVIVTISHLYTIFPSCIYIASILNAMYMHFKQTHVYAIRSTTRYITHSKYRNWSKCDVHRILNCDIYRIYFLNAMYVASACGGLNEPKAKAPLPHTPRSLIFLSPASAVCWLLSSLIPYMLSLLFSMLLNSYCLHAFSAGF